MSGSEHESDMKLSKSMPNTTFVCERLFSASQDADPLLKAFHHSTILSASV